MPAQRLLLFALLAALLACGRMDWHRHECSAYEPATAKRTFDGRVGSITFRNATFAAVQVEAYHPDGDGSVELRWTVPPGAVVNLGGGFGNDWGIRVRAHCIATLGSLASWADGRFALEWRDGRFSAGDPAVAPQSNLRAAEEQ